MGGDEEEGIERVGRTELATSQVWAQARQEGLRSVESKGGDERQRVVYVEPRRRDLSGEAQRGSSLVSSASVEIIYLNDVYESCLLLLPKMLNSA